MAQTASSKADSKTADGAAAPAATGSRRGLILGMVALVLVSTLVTGATVWYLARPAEAAAEKPHAADKAEPAAAAKPQKKGAPVFLTLELFTVNLADRDHYLQLGVVYQVDDGGTVEALKTGMPVIRSRILLLLSGKTVDDLSSAQGKAQLAKDLIAQARASLAGHPTPDAVSDVHFSAFVIQ